MLFSLEPDEYEEISIWYNFYLQNCSKTADNTRLLKKAANVAQKIHDQKYLTEANNVKNGRTTTMPRM